jgi:predicted bacteriocin transport accessory protein
MRATFACFKRVISVVLTGILISFVSPFAAAQEIELPRWFKTSFLDFRDDIKEAAAAHKRVIIYFGQNGCIYCRRLMEVNFKQADIVARTQQHFDVVEINIVGSRDVTWRDGTTMTEKEFARAIGVRFTPTLIFLDDKGAVLLRANGYYPPRTHLAALNYVIDGAFRSEPDFQNYLKKHSVEVPARGAASPVPQ